MLMAHRWSSWYVLHSCRANYSHYQISGHTVGEIRLILHPVGKASTNWCGRTVSLPTCIASTSFHKAEVIVSRVRNCMYSNKRSVQMVLGWVMSYQLRNLGHLPTLYLTLVQV